MTTPMTASERAELRAAIQDEVRHWDAATAVGHLLRRCAAALQDTAHGAPELEPVAWRHRGVAGAQGAAGPWRYTDSPDGRNERIGIEEQPLYALGATGEPAPGLRISAALGSPPRSGPYLPEQAPSQPVAADWAQIQEAFERWCEPRRSMSPDRETTRRPVEAAFHAGFRLGSSQPVAAATREEVAREAFDDEDMVETVAAYIYRSHQRSRVTDAQVQEARDVVGLIREHILAALAPPQPVAAAPTREEGLREAFDSEDLIETVAAYIFRSYQLSRTTDAQVKEGRSVVSLVRDYVLAALAPTRAREATITVAGIPVRVDSSVPPDEIRFEQDGRIVTAAKVSVSAPATDAGRAEADRERCSAHGGHLGPCELAAGHESFHQQGPYVWNNLATTDGVK